MAIQVTKGQQVELTCADGNSLRQITVRLGWSARTITRNIFFGLFTRTKHVAVDLDASCLLFDENKNVLDAIWWNNFRSADEAVVHTGDDVDGGGKDTDPNETIRVHLDRIGADVSCIVFVVNSYSGEDFSGIPMAFASVNDSATQQEVARYDLHTDSGAHKGFIIAKVSRMESGWAFHAIGEHCTGRQQTIQDIQAQARNHV